MPVQNNNLVPNFGVGIAEEVRTKERPRMMVGMKKCMLIE
jgi:hypothetical protein